MRHAPRPYTVEEVVDALKPEVLRLRAEHGPDLGRPYVVWKRRLDDLMGFTPERDIAHSQLLAIYEGAAQ
jgi:hypothetical protein